MKNRLLTVLLAMTGLLSLQAQAGLIQNGSFEYKNIDEKFLLNYNNGLVLGSHQEGWDVFSNIWGWQTAYGHGLEIQKSGLLTTNVADSYAKNGAYYAELDSHYEPDQTQANSGIYQNISGLKKGATYELSFWYQPRSKDSGNSNQLNIFWFDKDSVNMADLISKIPNATVGGNNLISSQKTIWKQYVMNFKASSDQMTIAFGAGGTSDAKGAMLDDVTLNEVPTPSSMLLVGLGLFGLLVRKLTAK